MTEQALTRAGCAGVILGLAAVVGGFYYDVMFAGIPYQDPTPELHEQYELHSGIAFYLEATGGLILAVGCLLWVAAFFCKWGCKSPRRPRAGGSGFGDCPG